MVNVAFDAPVDFAPRAQIEDAERSCTNWPRSGRYDGGFQRFAQALTVAVDMAAKAFQRDGKLVRHRHRLARFSTPRWAACNRPI